MSEELKSRMRLADAISELRREIARAKLEGEGREIRFRAKEIELELSIDFELGAEVEGGLPKWIPFVEAKVKGSVDRKSAHKIVMHLEIDGTGGGGEPQSNSAGAATGSGKKSDAGLIADIDPTAPKPQ